MPQSEATEPTAQSTDEAATNNHPTLARTMGLGALVIYGVGDMLGAGVYATIGKVAGTMGNAVWIAFLASMVAAVLTGLSYASIGSRYPRAAGAAYVTHRAFNKNFLTYTVGLAVIASGLTSMAAQSRAFSGYLLGIFQHRMPGTDGVWPEASNLTVLAIALSFIAVLTLINFWGMRESTWVNALCTFVEVSGLLFIIAIGYRYWGSVNYFEVPAKVLPGPSKDGLPVPDVGLGSLSVLLVLQGAALTFYSFVGFEDMLNVAEEVKDPRRNFPKAVVLALGITTVIYIAISITAVSVMPYAQLNASGEPLVSVVKQAAPWFPPILFSLIALFAITNTGLLNYIMGSRLVYGLARQGFVPAYLGAIHPARRTPHRAIVVLMVIVMALAIIGDLSQLAAATSAILLTVFIVVNGALIVLQRRPDEPKGAFEIPSLVPAGGIAVCAAMLSQSKPEARYIALALLTGIAVLYLIMRPSNITEDTLTELTEENA